MLRLRLVRPRTYVTLCLLAVLPPLPRLSAQEMDVPVSVQAPVMLKVLSFDRNFRANASGPVVIGIAYQSGNRASTLACDDATRAFITSRESIHGRAIRVISIDLDHERLGAWLKQHPVSALYIAPLRAGDIQAMAALAREAKTTTMTGVIRYVSLGLAIGVGEQGGRPKIFLNLESSRLEGADFPAELLKLVQIVQ